MKKLFMMLLIAVATLTNCKKDEPETVDTTSMMQLSKDDADIQNLSEDVILDANNIVSKSSNKIGDNACNATIDSSLIEGDTITYMVTYNGLNCNGNKTRVGQAKIKKNKTVSWSTAGSKITITFINLKVTKSNGKTMTLNGTKTIENVSGGLVKNLGTTVNAVTHKVYGSLQATFDDGTTRTWNLNRQKIFTGTLDNLTITVNGFGSADGFTNLVSWGVNRHGENFYTTIEQSIVHKQECNFEPSSGIKIHSIPSDSKKSTITFGYDSNNIPTTNTCPTRYRLDWEKNTKSGTVYLPL